VLSAFAARFAGAFRNVLEIPAAAAFFTLPAVHVTALLVLAAVIATALLLLMLAVALLVAAHVSATMLFVLAIGHLESPWLLATQHRNNVRRQGLFLREAALRII
jgi:hypothetical protein